MAPEASLSVERLQRFGLEAVRKVRRKEQVAYSVTLSCEYLGVSVGEGRFDASSMAQANLNVGFEWLVKANAYEHTHIVTVRCDNLASRGVTFPLCWRMALQSLDLDDIVSKTVERVIAQSGSHGVRCQLLGRPPPAQLSEDSTTGAFATFNGFEHVLCAHILGEQWLAHRGNIDECGQIEEGPLRESDLVSVDLSASQSEQRPRKRIRPHLHTGQIQDIIQASPRDFDVLVAFAAFRAEVVRAQLQGRSFDKAAALCNFERNPFVWAEAEGHHWNITVIALWTWHARGAERRELVSVRLDNLRNQGLPVPDVGDENFKLMTNLEQVATSEAVQRRAPCRYLGLSTQGRYEPDPSRWPQQACPDGKKTHASVHFEWQHVLRGSAPHRVECRAHDVVNNGRPVPWNPLSPTSPTGLAVTKDFLKAVATNTHPGILFKGIVLDAERPDIKSMIPNQGVDILNEPFYWSLPDGRVVCWSVMELAQKHNDELFLEDVHEAYLEIAKDVGYDVLGKPICENEFEQFRADVGVLEERRWKQLEWESPVDENCPCWFVANSASPDKTETVKIVCRSLLALKMELQQNRVASTDKLRREWERRLEENATAAVSLSKNVYWWGHVDGPDPALLYEPTPVQLAEAQRCAAALQRMVEEHKPTDGTDTLVAEITRAATALKVVSWESIYADRFYLTPYEMFQDMVKSAEVRITRHDAEAERRCARLAEPGAEDAEAGADPGADSDSDLAEPDPGNNYVRLLPPDAHLDIDKEFKFPGGRDRGITKPSCWKRTVRLASEIHINEMRLYIL